MKIQGRKKRRGASILLMSFLFLVVLFLLASAMYQLIPSEMHAANRSHRVLNAHHVANSGVRQSVEWLTDSMKRFEDGEPDTVLPDYSPTYSASDLPNIDAFETFVNNQASPFADDRWKYEVDLVVDPTTIGNSHNFQPRVFHIKSTALYNGTPIRTVDAWVRQSTFASFAYYTDEFVGEMRIDGDRAFAGPVHTNDYFVFNVLDANQLDPTKPGYVPYFDDEVTFADTSYVDPGSGHGDGNEWSGAKPYDTGGVLPGAYERIFKGGRNDLRSKSEITLPSTTDELGELAYGKAKSEFPTERGVHIPDHDGDGFLDAGIFVQGDVNELFMGLDEVGNQRMVFENWVKNGTKQVNDGWITPPEYGPWQSYSPPKWNYKNECTGGWVWVDPPDNGGVAQGPTKQIKQCLGYTKVKTSEKKWRKLLDPGERRYKDVDDWDKAQQIVVEAEDATELKHSGNVVKYPDDHPDAAKRGQNVTAASGETIIATMIEDDDVGDWVVKDVEVLKGMPNGTIYINDGSISGNENGWDGLHGLVKGTPDYDDTLKAISKDGGKTKYNSKVIATDLDHSVAFSGDLLQFDPDKFDAYGSKDRLDNRQDVRYLMEVARDPRPPSGDPELSLTADHVLGIVTKDAWMKAQRRKHWMNGNDKINDVYAIILAGKTVDPDANVDGDEYVVGGFGTYWKQLTNNKGYGAMGDFRVYGGVIQGTTGENQDVTSNRWRTAHYWINDTGQRGYQVQMHYDRVATYQRLFPTYAEFEVIRYLERAAKT